VRRSAILRCILFNALLLVLGLGASARRAEAGCHVADPPKILGTLLDRIEGVNVPVETVAVPPGDARFDAKPCRGEIPVSSTESISIPATYAVLAFMNATIPASDRFRAMSGIEVIAFDRDCRLDRPPRGLVHA
jgi:hypothetical protein